MFLVRISSLGVTPKPTKTMELALSFLNATGQLNLIAEFTMGSIKNMPCLGAKVAGSFWKCTLAFRLSHNLLIVSTNDRATSDTLCGLLKLFRRCISVCNTAKDVYKLQGMLLRCDWWNNQKVYYCDHPSFPVTQ